jgi:hypothetical protein
MEARLRFTLVECSTSHRSLQQGFISESTNEEQLDMIPIYGECRRIAMRARQFCSESYPEWNIPSIHTINNIFRKLWASGIWNRPNRCRSISVTHETNDVAILATAAHSPHVSTRHISWISAVQCQSYSGTPQMSPMPPVIASRTIRTRLKRSLWLLWVCS